MLMAAVCMLSIQCSKSDSASTPAGGCTFTFKGTSYSLPISVCVAAGGINGEPTNTAANEAGTQTLVMAQGGGDEFVSFAIIVSDPNSYYYSNLPGGTQTITISDKTWNFSGTLVNGLDETDTGTISGKCTCTISQ